MRRELVQSVFSFAHQYPYSLFDDAGDELVPRYGAKNMVQAMKSARFAIVENGVGFVRIVHSASGKTAYLRADVFSEKLVFSAASL